MFKSNKFAQESGGEIAMIKHLLPKIKFEVEIKLLREHEKGIIMCHNEPEMVAKMLQQRSQNC